MFSIVLAGSDKHSSSKDQEGNKPKIEERRWLMILKEKVTLPISFFLNAFLLSVIYVLLLCFCLFCVVGKKSRSFIPFKNIAFNVWMRATQTRQNTKVFYLVIMTQKKYRDLYKTILDHGRLVVLIMIIIIA